MQPEPGSPEQWLAYARSDLALARVPLTQDMILDALCFHAQQAAEKSIKAVLVHCGIVFPRVHSIERLVDLLPDSVERTPELTSSAELTGFATVFRYPGVHEPVSDKEYERALRLAESVVQWAEEVISGSIEDGATER